MRLVSREVGGEAQRTLGRVDVGLHVLALGHPIGTRRQVRLIAGRQAFIVGGTAASASAGEGGVAACWSGAPPSLLGLAYERIWPSTHVRATAVGAPT